ncbi:MAG TPA: ATP-binding cassette domain-containing protein [Leeuwenhoekiella sp.]|nr:ATP-binding cassette domain-containing protein [Leeuwenhoekiella sp.]
MREKEHLGIRLTNTVNKKRFIDHLFSAQAESELQKYSQGKGLLFSDLAIATIHEEERRYDKSLIGTRKLASHSSGERKKLFIEYILQQNPDFIILDNPLDHLDQASRATFKKQLQDISQEKTLIQLANRASDFLPFITHKFDLDEDIFTLNPISASPKENLSAQKQLNLPKNGQNTANNDHELLKMEQVCVSYDGRPIVKDISWTIRPGDFWQLVGPNGSGKSTLLALITGESTKGYGQDLYLFGHKKGSGESIWEIKQKIGYFAPNMTELFQRNNTLLEMVLSGFFDSIGLYDRPTTLQQKQAIAWLQLANLQVDKNINFNKLSPGQQRLGLILRAVVKNPPLLILDEPTEGLDDTGAQLVIDLVNTLKDQTEMAIIFVSHRVEKGLRPQSIFELVPTENGSTGKIILKNQLKSVKN